MNIKKSKKFTEAARRLLKGRFVLRSDNEQAFQSILDLKYDLEEYFSLLGAYLILNQGHGIAYLSDDSEFDYQVSFGQTKTLTAMETLLVIFLRQRRREYLTGVDIVNENVIASVDDMRSFCINFNKRIQEKRFNNSEFIPTVDSLKAKQFLSENSDGTYTISPICEVILPHDDISALVAAAQKYFSIGHSRNEEN